MMQVHGNPEPGFPEQERHIEELLRRCAGSANLGKAREAVRTVLRMLAGGVGEEDWRIAGTALRELETSFRVFLPYRDKRKVTVFGSARVPEDSEAFQAAVRFGRRIAELGFMVITGAGDGIMLAANQGAGVANSFGLNIDLPFEQVANRVMEGDDKLISFRYFFTRKLAFIRESDALVLFPGGMGTLDEAFELLTLIQCGRTPLRPIVMIDIPELNYWTKWLRFVQTSQLKNGFIDKDDLYLWSITYDVEEGCRLITNFYRNYHSQSFLGELMVLRLKRELSNSELAELNRDYRDMVPSGEFEQRGVLEEETEEARIESSEVGNPELPRLVFKFDRRSFGKLRRLIDRINQF